MRLVARYVAAVLIIAGSVSSLASARVSAEDVGSPPAVESLSQCIRESQQLAAVVLMDQSKSLRDTDKFGRRALLGAAFVDALSAASGFEIEDRKNRVDLLLVGFGTSLTNATGAPVSENDWTTLGPETLALVDDQLAGFANRNSDNDTDYVDALTGAMAALSLHSASMSPERPQDVCRLVLWFTDGKFDISTSQQRRSWAQDIPLNSASNTDRVVERGKDLLCAAQGVANELRRQSTFVFTLGLTSPKFTGADERLLRLVTLGTEGCGETDGSSLGWYLGDGDVDVLRQCVVKVFSGLPCSPNPDVVQCTASSPCEYRFNVDDSVAGIAGYAITSPAGGTVSLLLPDGSRLDASGRRNELDVGGALIRIEGTDGSYRLDADLEKNTSLVGEWILRFTPDDGGSLDAKVNLRSAYSFSLDAPSTVSGAEDVSLGIQLTGRSGSAVPTSGLGGSPEFEVVARQGSTSLPVDLSAVDDEGRAIATVNADDSESASTIQVTVSGRALDLDGKPIDLGRRLATISVVYPAFGGPPSSINLGVLEAERSGERLPDRSQPVLPLKKGGLGAEFLGPESGDGEVCLASAQFDGAVGSTVSMKFDSGDECASLIEGTSTTVPLAVAIESPTAGHLSGTATFVLTNLSSGEERSFSVPIEGDVVVPAPDPWTDVAMLWTILIAALLALLLAWVLGVLWASGLGPHTAEVRVFTFPAALTPQYLLVPNQRDQWAFVRKTGRREADVPSATLKSPIRWFGQNVVYVEPQTDGWLATGSLGHTKRRNQRAVIAHGLALQWVFLAEPPSGAGTQVKGVLLVFMPNDRVGHRPAGTPDPVFEVVADAEKRLPATYSALAARPGDRDKAGVETPGGVVGPTGYGRKGP